MTDGALKELSPELDRLYASGGRPSIAPEKLLRAAVAGVVLAAERAVAEGGDELQPAVPLVRWVGDGRRGVGCDGVHQESGTAAGGRDLAEVFAGGGKRRGGGVGGWGPAFYGGVGGV